MDGICQKLQYETLLTPVKPFNAPCQLKSMGFHTCDSDAEHPHSYVSSYLQRVNEPESGVVAALTTAVAWDTSMQNLLYP
jgi:hypothetical protein